MLAIVSLSFSAIAQPLETIYEGTVIATGFKQNIQPANDGPFPIGFDFAFFGITYTQFYVSANGLIMFTDPDGFYDTAVTIPDNTSPNNYIAPFWDNLSILNTDSRILYRTFGVAPYRKCIIQFKNMGFDPVTAPFGTFFVILYEDNSVIQIQYRLIVDAYSPVSHGANATIGLENSDGSSGYLYAFHDGVAVNTEDAISFTWNGSAYTDDANALYDGVYLTSNEDLPDPGIANLVNPPADAVLGADQTFEWSAASNASVYFLAIDNNSSLATATYYYPGANLSYDITGLSIGETYYWAVFSYNTTATTWCEVRRFTTAPPHHPVPTPQTIYAVYGQDKTIKLNYTGGDGNPASAIISSLPSQGQLYQYNAGVRGSPIISASANVTDAGMNVIYAPTGTTGNGVGNFNFRINQSGYTSEEATITVNVSPPGVPNILCLAKDTNVEIQFDRTIANPAGNEANFGVKVDETAVTISSVSLKSGDPYTIVLTLSPGLTTGSETVLVSYTPGTVAGSTGGLLLPFADQPVTLTAQTISFTQSLDKKISDSPFALLSTASSELGMTYSSSNFAVATINSNIATFLSIGQSLITARQAGNTTYAPAKSIRTLTVAKGDQTITFNALPSKTVVDADFPPGATTTSGLQITYVSYNTSVATIVSGNIHIVAAGSAIINASQAGNTLWNAATSVSQTLTVSGIVTDKTLNLTSVMLEGLYNGSGTMRQAWNESGPQWPPGVADHITVELHSATSYSTVVYYVADVPLSTVGTATVSILAAYDGSYYITIKHRNSIETTTAVPISFSSGIINQSFGTQANVYGGNLGESIDGYYLIYGGDVNQDGFVDTQDYVGVDNDSYNYVSGYLATDSDGNGTIDTNDYILIDNNNYNYIGTIHP